MSYQLLSESVQTLYAELLEQAIVAQATATTGGERGSFVAKRIKGKTYWYHQRMEADRKRQIYLGPETPQLLEWIAAAKEARAAARIEADQRAKLCDMLAAGGAFVENPTVVKVLQLLSEGGLFRLGAVLVGTHAFAAYGNMLGVRFEQGALRTQDVDIAHLPGLAIALSGEQADIAAALTSSELGFHEVPALDRKHPSTSFKIRGREMRVDFITPLVGRERSEPIFLPEFNVAAQPMRLLDYLIEEIEQAAIVGGTGILVNVPHPGRFALHKLLVSERRQATFQAKRTKDMRQAALLIEVLLDRRPGSLQRAWEALRTRRQAAQLVRHALALLDPGLQKRLTGIGIKGSAAR